MQGAPTKVTVSACPGRRRPSISRAATRAGCGISTATSTWTEIIQIALRVARAHTKKHRFVRFEGHFHGSADNIMGGGTFAEKDASHPVGHQTQYGYGTVTDPVPLSALLVNAQGEMP